MNTFSSKKIKSLNPRNILGGIPDLLDETGFETETFVSTVTKGAGEVFEATVDLLQDLADTKSKTETNDHGRFSINDSIEFSKNQQAQIDQLQKQKEDKEETARQKAFFQVLKEDQERAQRAKDKLLFEEEINDIVTNLPTEQKNRLLHYQTSYRDRSVYQRAELRRRIIEERNKSEAKQKEAPIPSPAKQPFALEGAFEGRSGTQGGGTANLSAQAVG